MSLTCTVCEHTLYIVYPMNVVTLDVVLYIIIVHYVPHFQHNYVLSFSTDVPPEYCVFIKKYSALVDTLKNTDLYRYFVSEEIITLAENEELSAEVIPIKKVEILLRKISSPLESGHTKSFYVMLEIMASYGNRATKELSRNINETIHGSVSDDGKI